METVEAELCFPHLHNSSCRKAKFHPTQILVTDLLLSTASMLTCTLNLLVIISIAHFRQLHSSTNLILLSLAVSDFLVGLVVMPAEGLMWRMCWTLGDLLCVLYFILPITFFMASVGNIVLISVDRYVAICDPLHYQTRMSKKAASICISICWFYAFFYAMFFLFESFKNLGKYKSCQGECVIYYNTEADITMAFIIPVSIIVILYLRVFRVASSQARAMRSHVTVMRSKTIKKSEMKAARNLGVIVFVYLICYCPYFTIVLSGTSTTILGIPIFVFAFALIYLNSCLNPLIYAMIYPWFRKTIKLIVTLRIMRPGSSDLKII